MKINLNILIKIFQIINAFFWKGRNVIYINSNKKIFDQSELYNKKYHDFKCIVNESITHKVGLKFNKKHFIMSKIKIYQITRNLKYNPNIVYAGYVSTPFAIFDGYCLGDNRNYNFFDTSKNNNKTYKIDFKKNRLQQYQFDINTDMKEVDLLISSSYKINTSLSKTNNIFEYDKKCNDKIDSQYLSDIFYFVSDFLDECRNKSIQKVHLLCSSRQPVSFVVGLAIQSHHPEVFAYEFEGGKYTWSVDIQKAKLVEIDKNVLS